MFHLFKRSVFMLVALLFFNGTIDAQTFWMQHAGGPTIDEGMDVSLDGAGNTYVTGYFTSAATFGSTTLSSSGIDDVFLAKLGTNGLFSWAVKAGGPNSDRALSIKTDAAGNSYITGFFYGTANFGSQSVTAAGAQDIFIAKYDNTGTCLWAKSAGGTLADIGNGITVDNSGNVIVTGEFAGTATFGSTSMTSMNGSTDVFTTKLDGNGNFLWAKQGAAPLTDRGLDVACDATGNIYITGQFSDTITFDFVHNNNMLNAVFIVKYDPSGQEQWYRKIGGGAMNVGNSIACDNANGIYLTGDFQGTITFFGTTNTNLGATYANRIFLAKYDDTGGLAWDIAESSDSPLTSRSVATDGTDCFITGNFKCTFDSYSDRYGAGLFNSSGYWDIFEAKYSNSGAWNMSRQLGGRQDQLCNGIAIDAAGNPHLAGSYDFSIATPVDPSFYGYPTFNGYGMSLNNFVAAQSNYCSDPYYNAYGQTFSAGNSDIFVGNPIDPNRLPFDYYYRNGSGCTTPYVGVCINQYTGLNYLCGNDTINFCQQGQLYASSMTSTLVPPDTSVGPSFTYLWSNSQTNSYTNVTTSGYYSVTMTTADGCYTSQDTIYVHVNQPAATPTISDNVVINNNATITQPIVICADSVILTGGNFGNDSVYWRGPAFDPYTNPHASVVVDSSGTYSFVITDANGCSSSNQVQVTLDHPLVPILPAMVCLNDTDGNDSLTICDNLMCTVFPYDTLTNPFANILCIDELTQVLWTITPSTNATIVASTNCNNNFAMTFVSVHQSGWYTITETIIRQSPCGNDTTVGTHSYYFTVLPSPPPGSLVLTITGNVQMCPGDSAILVVSGGTSYIWNNASTNDTLVVYQPGTYSVVGFNTVTNSYGCSSVTSGQTSVTVSFTQQPLILMNPSDGIICPGDSVELNASGNGLFSWQGPNGPVGGNGHILYVTTPGIYNCVLSTPDSCQLLSNSVTVQVYNTPSIQASPSGVICPGDTITISLTASSGSSITWLPPLSGNGLTQIITQPGVYSCSVLACNITTTVSVTIVPSPVSAAITPLTSTTACQGDSIELGANAGMFGYVWQPGNSTGQSIYVFNDGLYYLTTSDSGGCMARDSFQVTFTPNLLSPPTTQDTLICKGTPVTLAASGSPTLTWYNSATGGTVIGTGSPLVINGIQNDTAFYVLTNDGVCKSQRDVVHVMTEDCTPVIPNVFTPNGDGSNDVFTITDPFATGIHVWIYNRWGELIYEWNDVNGSWNGTYMVNDKPVPDGVYYYIAEITDQSNTISKKTGFIELIRNGPK